jgi:hypothetical protein
VEHTVLSAFRALDAARAAGVDVRLDGKDLVVSAASEPPTDVLDTLRRHKLAIVALLQPTRPWDSEDWQAHYDERAAIAEFDGGLSRQEAEAVALDFCVGEWLSRDPVDSDADDGCLVCNESDRANDILLAVGLGGAGQAWGQVWLHRGCAAAWRAGRIAEAVTALAALGITSTGSSP